MNCYGEVDGLSLLVIDCPPSFARCKPNLVDTKQGTPTRTTWDLSPFQDAHFFPTTEPSEVGRGWPTGQTTLRHGRSRGPRRVTPRQRVREEVGRRP